MTPFASIAVTYLMCWFLLPLTEGRPIWRDTLLVAWAFGCTVFGMNIQ